MPAAPPGAASGTRRSRYPSRPAVAAAIGLALALTSVAPIAVAGTPSVPPTPANAQPAPVPPDLAATMAAGDAKRANEKPLISPTDKAIAEAKKTGRPVPIPELTDEVSETVATPSGHLSRTEHVEPQRVKQNGAWATLDGTLVPDDQGGYRPRIAVSGVHLSGGGNGPLGTLTSPDGETLTIDSPFPLTKPVLDPGGEALVYPEVAPDVDLKVTASKFGGLSTVLIVKTAEAAANPQLQKIRFGTKGKGVTVRADDAGNLTAKAADGTARWHAPTPQMWDSSGDATLAATSAKSTPAQNGVTADRAQDDAGAPAKSEQHSTAEGPGTNARVATMATAVTGDAVELTTDASVLGKGQGPWFIDPGWLYDRREANAWTWTQSAYAGKANIGRTTASGDPYARPGVGYQGFRTDKGIERSYFQFDTRWYNDIVINKATMSMWEYESSDHSCTNKYTLDLYVTGPIDDGTTWNNPPNVVGSRIGSADVAGSGGNGCHDNVQFDYDVTWAYQTYATSRDALTFGVFARNEYDLMAFKRLTYNPVVVIEFDRVPNTPTNPYVSPAPSTSVPWADNQGCAGSYGWLNSSSGFNGSVTLNATVSSNAQKSLYGWTHIWDYADLSADVDSGLTPETPNGGVASFQVKPGVIKDGHYYGWGTMATDGLVQMSASTPVCHFGVDLTPPTLSVPDVYTLLPEADLANKFPPSGNGQVTKKRTGEQGLVPFTAADPSPGGNASGVVCARWSWDPQFAGAGWSCGADYPSNGIPVTPGRWGTNILYIQVLDNARNVSPVAQYSFYVPWNPDGPPPVFGDVTGDGAPDILLPDQAGYLRAYNAPGNPKVRTPAVTAVATPADAPKDTSWNDVQYTHRGTLTGGNNIDDVIVHAPGGPEMLVYQNPGNTGVYGRIDKPVPLKKPKCVTTSTEDCTWLTAAGYNATDWTATLRVAALGDPVSTDLDPKLGFKNKTGLLTVESFGNGTDAALWFYPATEANTLGTPVKLAASGWKDKELITPGDWAKQGHPGLWTRNLAGSSDAAKDDLLAYTFTTGTVTGTTKEGQPITDPTGKPLVVPTLTGIATTGKIGTVSTDGWTTLGSDGDLTGSGNASLWGKKTDGSIDIWWGQPAAPGNPAAGYNWQVGPATIANTEVSPQWWALDGTGDSGNTNTLYKNDGDPKATYPAGATLTTDHNHVAGKATAFDGATVFRTTAPMNPGTNSPGLDTTQSYSVSAWVKINNTNGHQTAVSLTGDQLSPFYLQYSRAFNNWAFVLPSSDSTNANAWYTAYDQTGRTAPAVGVWTHLTGTYNAGSGAATLYVNGQAVGSTQVPTTWKPPTGGLNVGGVTSNRLAPTDLLNGAISDVRVYPYALTDPQANIVATSQAIVQVHSAVDPHKCLDNWGGGAGAQLAIYDCYNGDSQHFLTTRQNELRIPTTGLCLGTRDANVVDGTPVVAQPCGNPATQTWIRRYDGSVYNPAADKCLDLNAWNTTNGAGLDVWQCGNQANHHWIFEAQTL
ncbi:LamG-like jellyroll fold domain-containing protein [Kitasatospora sp. NPDC087861]|uniref:LamG-like jellyroll fold domain-containing protein n=1 Tax=Kitasatospora sp. NPDC087861 TaxID=3364070 RepID=UPI00382C2441